MPAKFKFSGVTWPTYLFFLQHPTLWPICAEESDGLYTAPESQTTKSFLDENVPNQLISTLLRVGEFVHRLENTKNV